MADGHPILNDKKSVSWPQKTNIETLQKKNQINLQNRHLFCSPPKKSAEIFSETQPFFRLGSFQLKSEVSSRWLIHTFSEFSVAQKTTLPLPNPGSPKKKNEKK